MKNVILTLVTVLAFNLGNAQERVNRISIKFDSTLSIKPLTEIAGWSFNEKTSTWVDNTDIVSSEDYDNSSLRGSSYHKSRNSQNIGENIEFKTITYSGSTYYVLLWDYVGGSYKYPNIHRDWEEYKNVKAVVFTESEFNKLKLFKTAESATYFTCGKYGYSESEVKILNSIQNWCEKGCEISEYSSHKFIVSLAENGEDVRFLLPEREKYRSPLDISKKYFEVKSSVFNSFLGIK
tara:strand:+ start:551 stop:1258 length:708 start_codon:yes stop_codon:yes gene_type:complete